MDTVLYVGPARPGGDPLGLLDRAGSRRLSDGTVVARGPRGEEIGVLAVSDPAAALAFLRERPVDALVTDTRVHAPAETDGSPSQGGPFALTRAGELLAGLYPERQLFTGVPRNRVLGVVGAGATGTDAAYNLGRHHIAEVLAEPSVDTLLDRLGEMLERHATGKIAICLAGGGIEGLLYEIGVLRALDAHLDDRSLVDIDLFCGISAGAVIGSFLANGVGPEEVGRGLTQGTARIDPIRRSEIFDPNFGEVPARLRGLARDFVRGGVGPRGALSALARALPSAAFAGDRLREYLRRQLQKPGMSDRFDGLRRPLFVGATDQDTSDAVVFGEEGMTHVPVHRAVRASAALAPFYAPERIDGRYYVDGAFSRTTNMRVAVRQGATLVILVDPLVPVYSEEPGYVHQRGGMFGTMQGLKGLINGRFDKAVYAIADMFPDVSFWLFRPEADEMRMLSGSPMRYFYRREVEELAYQSTTRKIRGVLPEMTRDFARHGVTLRAPQRGGQRAGAPSRLEPRAIGVGV